MEIQKKCFKGDTARYNKVHSPETETEETIHKFLHSKYILHYTVLLNNQIIGGARVVKFKDDECSIGRLFINPVYQNKGYGKIVMKRLETKHKNCKKFTLNTPKDRENNILFYQKIGYKIIGEIEANEDLILVQFEKRK